MKRVWHDWKERVRAWAREEGLDALAFASAEPFVEEAQRLADRREAGLHCRFEPGGIEDRTRPDRLLPGVRAIIAFAVAYRKASGRRKEGLSPAAKAKTEFRPPRGLVSRYAFGRDYHRVMHERAEGLMGRLQQACPESFSYRICVDTSPPLDRAVALRAGLGFIGKNASLITKEYGAWVFLGEILITLPFPPDTPEALPDCGECRRCLDACPTGALTAPYQLDPHRCLGYLNQASDWIEEEYRRKMGRWVWGCDACYTACPYNHANPEGRLFGPVEPFLPDPQGARPDLVELLEISKSRFRRRFGPTAAAWRGKRTLQRNALIALGNARRQETLPAVARHLEDDRADMRAYAAWALGRIGGPEARARLLAAWQREEDERVREELEKAWGEVSQG